MKLEEIKPFKSESLSLQKWLSEKENTGKNRLANYQHKLSKLSSDPNTCSKQMAKATTPANACTGNANFPPPWALSAVPLCEATGRDSPLPCTLCSSSQLCKGSLKHNQVWFDSPLAHGWNQLNHIHMQSHAGLGPELRYVPLPLWYNCNLWIIVIALRFQCIILQPYLLPIHYKVSTDPLDLFCNASCLSLLSLCVYMRLARRAPLDSCPLAAPSTSM